MDRAVAAASTPAPVVFQDGLGERRRVVDSTGTQTYEVLCLRGDLTAVPSFEFALRERVSHLANFRHAYYGRVRSVDRLNDPASTLALVSECIPGVRLADLLTNAERRGLTLDINAALCLIRQLVPAVAFLHENASGVAHGAIGPERIIVTTRARLAIVEYVMGAALEQLRYSHERYWKELHIAVPQSPGLPRFDQRTDVTQIGIVALSLILGRLIDEHEYPGRIGEVLASAWAMSERGEFEPLPAGLRSWLARALQVDVRNAFSSVLEARAELEKVLSGDVGYIGEPSALEAFLARYNAAAAADNKASGATSAAPAPRVEPPPVPKAAAPEAPRKEPARVNAAPPPPQKPAAQPKAEAPRAPETPKKKTEPVAASKPQGKAAGAPPSKSSYKDIERELDAILPSQPAAPAPVLPRVTVEERQPRNRTLYYAAAAVIVLAVAGVAAFAARGRVANLLGPGTGTLAITTNPAGAQVVVDGQARGVTPLTVSLKAGAHRVELRGNGEPRVIPVTMVAGSELSQYVELPKSAPAIGQLQVRSDPAGARVSVDGVARGTAPLTISELAPGEHSVVLEGDRGSVTQTVNVEAGATASLVVPMTAAAPAAPTTGWIRVTSPVDMQVFENGRLLGTTDADRIVLPPGNHQLELVNEASGFRTTRGVQIQPGKISSVGVKVPNGTIALNAIPWAEVWVDGVKAGDTPIGNLNVSVGRHEILFRHPDLGEQRQTVTVGLTAPARVSVDMRKK